jgi:hypothetical protein
VQPAAGGGKKFSATWLAFDEFDRESKSLKPNLSGTLYQRSAGVDGSFSVSVQKSV